MWQCAKRGKSLKNIEEILCENFHLISRCRRIEIWKKYFSCHIVVTLGARALSNRIISRPKGKKWLWTRRWKQMEMKWFLVFLSLVVYGKSRRKNCWKRSLNEREFESMTTLSSFLTLSPLDRNNAEHRSTIESKINSRCECRPGQQSPFTVQCSRESSAHYYMVSPVRLRLILPHSLDPTHHAVAVVAVCTKCWWEGRRPMGEFSSWLHFCADSMKMKAGKVFLQRFHKSKFPIISFPLFHTLHARIVDLQSHESVWWAEARDCLDSPLVSDGSHDAATSNCQLRCLRNIQLFGVVIFRCANRMVSQWKIHNQQWYSRKQQVSFESLSLLLIEFYDKDIDMAEYMSHLC